MSTNVEIELEPWLDVMTEEMRAMNLAFFELMRQSAGSFEVHGAFGLKASTCKAISELTEEQAVAMVEHIKSPILQHASGRRIDNTAMDEMDKDVREGWGALAATLGMWVRESLRYHGQSLRALVGQGCECELASNEVPLSSFLSDGYGPLRTCSSRYSDDAWTGIATVTSRDVMDVMWKRSQVRLLHGRGNCLGCPRMKTQGQAK